MMTWSSAECILPLTAALQDAFDGVQQMIGRLSLQMALDTAGIHSDRKCNVPASHLMR